MYPKRHLIVQLGRQRLVLIQPVGYPKNIAVQHQIAFVAKTRHFRYIERCSIVKQLQSSSSEVQLGHLVASMGIAVLQYGQFFIAGAGASFGFCIRW